MPKKELIGSEIAGYIQQRQIAHVRSLKSAEKIVPKLAIVRTNTSEVIDVYLKLKSSYAEAIGAEVEIFQTTESEAIAIIDTLNRREDVHGIIIQLPLEDTSKTDELLNAIVSQKDVDGLATKSQFDPATPVAILWLLASYNIEPKSKKVLVIGQGRLVGAPLTKLLKDSGVDVAVADENTKDLQSLCLNAEIIITATGQPRLITSAMVSEDAIIIDAGTSTEDGVVVGDVSDDLRSREDIAITPMRGGVGPLTVAALFENLLIAVRLHS